METKKVENLNKSKENTEIDYILSLLNNVLTKELKKKWSIQRIQPKESMNYQQKKKVVIESAIIVMNKTIAISGECKCSSLLVKKNWETNFLFCCKLFKQYVKFVMAVSSNKIKSSAQYLKAIKKILGEKEDCAIKNLNSSKELLKPKIKISHSKPPMKPEPKTGNETKVNNPLIHGQETSKKCTGTTNYQFKNLFSTKELLDLSSRRKKVTSLPKKSTKFQKPEQTSKKSLSFPKEKDSNLENQIQDQAQGIQKESEGEKDNINQKKKESLENKLPSNTIAEPQGVNYIEGNETRTTKAEINASNNGNSDSKEQEENNQGSNLINNALNKDNDQNSIDAFRMEFLEFKKKVKEQETITEELKRDNKNLQDKLERVIEDNKNLQDKLERVIEDNKNLQDKLERVTEDNKNIQDKFERVTEELKRDNKNLSDKIEKMEKDISELKTWKEAIFTRKRINEVLRLIINNSKSFMYTIIHE